MTRIRMFVATAVIATTASLAHADSIAAPRLSQVVKYADLNLSNSAGAQRLYMRLQGAAKSVCRPLEGRELKLQGRFAACVKEAVSTAVADVNAPLLTQIHRSHDSVALTASIGLNK